MGGKLHEAIDMPLYIIIIIIIIIIINLFG